MNLSIAKSLAKELMMLHGLEAQGWRFAFDNSKRRFGCCFFGRKIISMSEALVEANCEDQVRDTILHEIAHALAPKGAHHDWRWKEVAARIGARPERCYSSEEVEAVKGDWVAKCKGCGCEFNRHTMPRMGKRFWCRKCGPVVGLLAWTRPIETEEDRRRFARNEASRLCKQRARRGL